MTNADKYKLDAYAIEGLTKDFDDWYYRYERNIINTEPSNLLNEFLNADTKPTLTEDERVILRNIKNEEYGVIIGRDKDTFFMPKKLYLKGTDNMKAFAISTLYNHLFQFIKERRRIFY